MSRFLALIALALTFAQTSPASDVGVLVEHIELDQATATQLLHARRPSRDASALRGEIQKHIAAREARVVDSAFTNSSFPLLAETKSVHEYLHPSRWSSAKTPNEIEVPLTVDIDFMSPAAPHAFRFRELGNALTVKPNLTREGDIHLTVTSEIATLLSRDPIANPTLGVEVPRFEIRKINSEFRCRDRKATLIGVITPRHAEKRDRRVLVFATAYLKKSKGDALEDPLVDPFAPIPEEPPAKDLDRLKTGIPSGIDFIELDQKHIAALLDGIPANYEAKSNVRQTVDQLVERGEAKILTTSFSSNAGFGTIVQPAHELNYPSNYEPPQVIKKLTAKALASGKPIISNAFPTAYRSRDLGLLYKIESIASTDEKFIAITLDASHVARARSITWGIEQAAAKLPIFDVQRCKTSLTLRPGEDAIAAILTPRDAKTGNPSESRRIAILVWADLPKAKR